VKAGVTILGPRPTRATSRKNFPAADAEVVRLAEELWNGKTGKGRVLSGKSAREVLLADGVQPDCAFASADNSDLSLPPAYFHRTMNVTELYFVASRWTNVASARYAFRVSGKAPELWNAVTGERRFVAAYEERGGRTFVPLDFDPCGSWFVVFREPAAKHRASAKSNSPTFAPLQEISGPWTVRFDTNWGGPAAVQFDQLVSWPERPEPGIKFYSGTAIYQTTFDLPQSAIGHRPSAFLLDLGRVHELAEVRLNGKSCGVTWSPPFRVDITSSVKPGANTLEIEVVNFWPNRIIGDASLPKEQRLTRTNIRKLTKDTKLMESGLLGPVRLLRTAP
jgi:hypothetical protein